MKDLKNENSSWQGESIDIKFRWISIHGWRVYWYYAYTSRFSNTNDYYKHLIITKEWEHKEVLPETVWQYVWLEDKNWVNIYKGDIVNIEDQDYTEKTLWIIQRAQGGFDIGRTMYWKNRWWHNLYFLSPYLMVVWNIYENPELVPEK